MNENLEVTIERLTNYTAEDAAGIGALMPSLGETLSAEPVDEMLLRDIIGSPFHDELVARLDGRIVGAATLALLMGPAAGRVAYLEDFVTDGTVQGKGIGSLLWNAMLEWCEEKDARSFEFTSHPRRQAAHQFYLARGCTIYDTSVFKKALQ